MIFSYYVQKKLLNIFSLIVLKTWLHLSKNQIKIGFPPRDYCTSRHAPNVPTGYSQHSDVIPIGKPCVWCHCAGIAIPLAHSAYMARCEDNQILCHFMINTTMFWIKPIDTCSMRLYMKIFISIENCSSLTWSVRNETMREKSIIPSDLCSKMVTH